jgi:hypothetical protein
MTSDKKKMERFFNEGVAPLIAEGRDIAVIGSAFYYDNNRLFKGELDKHYGLAPIGSRVNEDWHHALLFNALLRESLFTLRKK